MNDHGARCDKHVGEVFPPRCTTCESLNNEYQTLQVHDTEELTRAERDYLELGTPIPGRN